MTSEVIEKDARLAEIREEIDRQLSRHVLISHGEIMRLVTADLLAKYKWANERGMDSQAEVLKAVLTYYYLTPQEFGLYTSGAGLGL